MKSDPDSLTSISSQARLKRFRQFAQRLQATRMSQATLLDVGGTVSYWERHLPFLAPGQLQSIDVVNIDIERVETVEIGGVVVRSYQGNALDPTTLRLPHYDVVYSNSVIEHVGNLSAQLKMATVIRAIGTHYFVQTPAISFPIEPHFYFPYFHLLPLAVRGFLHQHATLGFMPRNPDWLQARIACEDTRLLTRGELVSLFPGCELLRERLFWLCKSHMVTNLPR